MISRLPALRRCPPSRRTLWTTKLFPPPSSSRIFHLMFPVRLSSPSWSAFLSLSFSLTHTSAHQESLGISLPYAFNYHLDQTGAFRGLAFANFRHAPDADAVVAALNGFDVQGRRLRVEYKKVLQASEKERIEREKAIRRMRSMQLEKEQQAQLNQLYDDFVPPFSPPRPFSFTTQPGPPSAPLSAVTQPSTTPASEKTPNELDMNDPSTLEIYSRVLLFKDDPMRDELAFSRSLTPKQRRVVHLIAQKLGVFHYSVGDGDERYAVVTRTDPQKVCSDLFLLLTTFGNFLAAVPSANSRPQPRALCVPLSAFSDLCLSFTSSRQKVHARHEDPSFPSQSPLPSRLQWQYPRGL